MLIHCCSGHVGELSACAWHPKEANTFITSSYDSTVRSVYPHGPRIHESLIQSRRIWDVENKRKQKTVIVVKSKERGARTKVTACAYSHDGKFIAAGTFIHERFKDEAHLSLACLDGTLNVWGTNSNFVRPAHTAENAHEKGKDTGSVVFSVDGHTLVSRSNDEYTKRMLKSVMHSHCALI